METSDFELIVAATKHDLQKKRRIKFVELLEHDSPFLDEYREEMGHVLGPPRALISLYETKLSAMFKEVYS